MKSNRMVDRLKVNRTHEKHRNYRSNVPFFFLCLKNIFKSKSFWVLMIAFLIVFMLTKSLNLINSIHDGIKNTWYTRQFFIGGKFVIDGKYVSLSDLDSLVPPYGEAEYTTILFQYFFSINYFLQLSRMEILYNFSIIAIVILTSYHGFFKKIKNGAILVYLTTPISKTKMMFFSLLASLLASFFVIFLFHSLDVIITSLTLNNFGYDNIKSDLDNNLIWLLKQEVATKFTLSTFSKDNNRLANEILLALESRTDLEYFNFFIFILLSSMMYITILMGIVYCLFLLFNITKTFALLTFLGVILGLLAMILVVSSPSSTSNNKVMIYILKFMFFPNLINDLIIRLVQEYGGISMGDKRALEALDHISNNFSFLTINIRKIISITKNLSTSSVKDFYTGETWFDKDLLYTLLPISCVVFIGVLFPIYRRVDWK